ncbi:MAG: hypothetical protein QOF60_1796 [Actinomycetota bacterium]|jgi:hypothetical protein|nr:hypothetical protein [Actinomycetota bacterium]
MKKFRLLLVALAAALGLVAGALPSTGANADAVNGTVVVFSPPYVVAGPYECLNLPFRAVNSDNSPFVGNVIATWTKYWWSPATNSFATDADGYGVVNACTAGYAPTVDPLYAFADRSSVGTVGKQDPEEIAGVLTAVIAPPSPPSAGVYPSDDCAAGTTPYSGYAAGDTFLKVATRQVSSQHTWVCVRIDGPSINYGGKYEIYTGSPGSGTLPTTDSNADACTSSSGNSAPGPHPLLSGTAAGTVPYLVDTWAQNGPIGVTEMWVCVKVGTTNERVIVANTGSDMPIVRFRPDAPGPHPGAPLPPNTKASAVCQANGGQRVTDGLVNGNRAYLYEWDQPSGARSICVRSDSAGGGVLTVYPVGTPSVTTHTNTTGCSFPINDTTSPVQSSVATSPPGALPASACLTVQGSTNRVTVTGPSGPIVPTWTVDS